jgi:hypothetical protein
MTGTPQGIPADAQDTALPTADADAKIDALLAVDPAALGIDMSDPKDLEDDDDGPPAPSQEEQKGNDEADEDPDDSDANDWDQSDTSEEDDDNADDGEPEGSNSRFVSDDGKVKLSDGRVTTIAALKKGTLLQEDYNQQQAQLGQQAQQMQAMQAGMQAQYAQIEQQTQVAMQMVEALLPPAPDARLAREDPVEYAAAQAEHQQIQSVLGQLMQQQYQLSEQKTASEHQANAATLGQEVETYLTAEPALRDQNKWAAFREEVMRVGGEKYGLRPEDLGSLNKSWMLRALTDAMRYHRLKAAKPKTREKVASAKPKTRKAGRRTSSADKQVAYREGLTSALQKSGRKEVADRLLETLVD